MTREGPDGGDDASTGFSRRRVLASAGGTVAASLGIGRLAYRADRSYEDATGDGIPDATKRSEAFDGFVREEFGADQFEGLEPGRRDLLLDARYVGEAAVSTGTKRRMEDLFRDHGIHLQWLDHPETYDRRWFESTYGYEVGHILWPRRSFYHDQVHEDLRDVSVQLVVVPDDTNPESNGRLDSYWHELHDRDDNILGMSLGNRAVVTEQDALEDELKLVLHEVAHLALCHDDDPGNTGVMGPPDVEAVPDLLDREWERLRSGLDNVRDTTGLDIVLRRCIWSEYVAQLTGAGT